jgi:hypothetical protein
MSRSTRKFIENDGPPLPPHFGEVSEKSHCHRGLCRTLCISDTRRKLHWLANEKMRKELAFGFDIKITYHFSPYLLNSLLCSGTKMISLTCKQWKYGSN